ncbi:MAG: hypothetical protein ABH861_02855 [Patescibacteria group bacterium]
MVRFCYLADTNKAIGQYGPFELQWFADPPGPTLYDWIQATFDMCVDTDPNDSVLECDLPLPSGTANFLFTVRKYDPQTKASVFWWGDTSYYVDGGCGDYNGTVTLTGPSGDITYVMQSNGLPGQYNGLRASIP